MPWVGFEPTISAGERPKTYALERTATGTGNETVLATDKKLYVTSGLYTAGFASRMWPVSFGISIQSREHLAVLPAYGSITPTFITIR